MGKRRRLPSALLGLLGLGLLGRGLLGLGLVGALSADVLPAPVGSSPAIAAPRDDHDRVRDNVRSGNLVPMREVVRRIRKRQPGRLLDAEHKADKGLYLITWQTPEGAVLRIRVNARTGKILSISRPGRGGKGR